MRSRLTRKEQIMSKGVLACAIACSIAAGVSAGAAEVQGPFALTEAEMESVSAGVQDICMSVSGSCMSNSSEGSGGDVDVDIDKDIRKVFSRTIQLSINGREITRTVQWSSPLD